MAEEIGDGTGLRYGVAESVVGIGGNGFAGGIEVAGNISVVVVERDVDGIIDCKIQQPAAASTLQIARDPVVVDVV